MINRRFFRAVALVFFVAWAVRSLILTGSGVLNQPSLTTLRTSPAATQATAGDGFARGMVALQSRLPAGSHILIVWDGSPSAVDRIYAFFWSTYWLHPRHVTIASAADEIDTQRFDVLLYVTVTGRPVSAQIPGYVSSGVLTYPDGFTLTTFVPQAHA